MPRRVPSCGLRITFTPLRPYVGPHSTLRHAYGYAQLSSVGYI